MLIINSYAVRSAIQDLTGSRARPLNDESCGVTWGIDCDSPFPLMEMVMARALSNDLRVRVLEAGAVGGSARSVAKQFEIGISTAIRWLRRERERAARRPGKPRGSRLDGHEAFIVGMIEAQKYITLNEMVARLKDEQPDRNGIRQTQSPFTRQGSKNRHNLVRCRRISPGYFHS